MIKTWQQRCEEHPDHDGIVSEGMVQARMQEEIDELRAALEPRQWQGLTDDEIALICGECAASAHQTDDLSYARAIEEHMILDTLKIALKTLQHINSVEHPVHTTVLPGELELAIESLHRAIEHHQPLCYYHPTSGRVRFDMPSSLSLGPSWIPLYKD